MLDPVDLLLAVPGPVDLATGGYVYDRRIMAAAAGLGVVVETLALPGGPPPVGPPALAMLRDRLAAGPVRALLIDGLALPGLAPLLDEITPAGSGGPRRIALVHHPCALETGLAPQVAADLARLERAALARVDAVVATSPATAALLRDQRWTDLPVRVIEPGLSVEPLPHQAARDGALRLLTVASLTPRKAHEDLVAALGQIGRDHDWRLDLVGPDTLDPPHAARVCAAIRAAGLGDRIRLHGVLSGDDLARRYAAADIFVLPSRFEGYGMAFAEALAAGLPVVAARAGAVPELVPDSAGILVPPGDVDALAEALRRLMVDAGLRGRLARAAAEAGARLPRWPDQARRLATLISEV
ncbi:glycosyltransferase family 4 protein [Tistrella mobilis]|uniref:glycosyltransferase family 4 protein n=1 Tax=Tistrella mobilis TaxID=171437 RepID=UPI003557723D